MNGLANTLHGEIQMSEQPKVQPVMNPVPDMKSFMDMISKQEDKTAMFVLMQLLNKENLEFITEYPNVNYTKLIVKLMTWRASVQEVFNLDDNEADSIIKTMVTEFMLKMTSHKRRRSQEITTALKHDPSQNTIYMEGQKRKRFFGLG